MEGVLWLDPIQKDLEFLAPETADQIPALVDAGCQGRGHLFQAFVPGHMAEGVVVLLEIVDVHHDDGDGHIELDGSGNQLFQPDGKTAAVKDLGQGIIVSPVLKIYLFVPGFL